MRKIYSSTKCSRLHSRDIFRTFFLRGSVQPVELFQIIRRLEVDRFSAFIHRVLLIKAFVREHGLEAIVNLQGLFLRGNAAEAGIRRDAGKAIILQNALLILLRCDGLLVLLQFGIEFLLATGRPATSTGTIVLRLAHDGNKLQSHGKCSKDATL